VVHFLIEAYPLSNSGLSFNASLSIGNLPTLIKGGPLFTVDLLNWTYDNFLLKVMTFPKVYLNSRVHK